MDALDIKILRAMGVQAYGRDARPAEGLKPSRLAKVVGASQERVKDRIRAMEKKGIIVGYELVPNHRHLGLEATCYYSKLPSDDAVDEAMGKLEPLDGVVGLYAFLGGVLCVNLASRTPADHERKLRMLVNLAGEGKLRKFYDLEMPAVDRPLSNLDWRIIRSLRGRAMRSLSDVARELGVSAKTAKRRHGHMSAEGSFFVVPQLDPSQAEGVLLFYLGFFFDPDAPPGTAAAVRKAFDGTFIATDMPSDLELGSYALMLAAPSMGAVDELRRKGAKVRGVARAETWMLRDAREKFEWVDEAIAERIKATGR